MLNWSNALALDLTLTLNSTLTLDRKPDPACRDTIQRKRKRLEDTEAARAAARARLADGGAQRTSLEARVAELLRMHQVGGLPRHGYGGAEAVHSMDVPSACEELEPRATTPFCVNLSV